MRIAYRLVLPVVALASVWSTPPLAAEEDDERIVVTSYRASLNRAEPTRGRLLDEVFNGGFLPKDVNRAEAGSVELNVVFCVVRALNMGLPVKGVRIDLGFDIVQPNNAFDRLIEVTLRTNRQGDAFAATSLAPGDPLFGRAQTASFAAFVAQPTNNKRIDRLDVSCSYAEVRDVAGERGWEPDNKFFRKALFHLRAPDPDCDLDTQNLVNGLPQVVCPTNMYQFDIRDRCKRDSRIEIQIIHTGQAPQGQAAPVITDLLTGDQFPTIQDRVAPGFDIFTREELYRMVCSF